MTKKRKPRKPITVNTSAYENEIQSSFYEMIGWSGNEDLKKIFHIPNGGHRLPWIAASLKQEGVKAGVLDNFLPVARGGYHGLWIEFKSKRRKSCPKNPEDLLSDEQVLFAQRVRQDGFMVIVCYEALDAFEKCEQYLRMSGYESGRNVRINLATAKLAGEA